MLRASLQLWQSLSCAKIVIVGQRHQKERSETDKNKATTPKQPQNQQSQHDVIHHKNMVKHMQQGQKTIHIFSMGRSQQEGSGVQDEGFW